MIVIVLLSALAAFGAFALATDGHHQRVIGRRPSASTKIRWRAAAWLALALSAAASIIARGWGFGIVWWFGAIMVAAGAVFLVLNLGTARLTK